MLIQFQCPNLIFSMGGYDFRIANIIYGKLDYTIPCHSHSKNSYEIHYVCTGHGHVDINGKVFEVMPNTLYTTGPFVEHTQIPDPNDPIFEYCIYLEISKSSACSDSSERTLIKFFRETVFWLGEDTQNVHDLLRELFSELELQDTGYFIQTISLLKQFVVKLLRNYEVKPAVHRKNVSYSLIDNQYLIIEKCFLDEYSTLTLKDLSARLGLSTRQTERLLKEHYGKTFTQKRIDARMSSASTLLKNPALSITQIAEQTGYSCVEHFSAAFKRYFGQSASSYRASEILLTNTLKTDAIKCYNCE